MKAEILPKPMPNAYPEVWFDAVETCTWVQFEDSNYEGWIGVFGRGDADTSKAVLFSEQNTALIIAGGKGYVVDIDSRQLNYHTRCTYLTDAIAVPSRDLVIGCGFTDLHAFSSHGDVWRSDRLALDGIRLLNASKDQVEGQIWDHTGWHSFVLDLKTWQIVHSE